MREETKRWLAYARRDLARAAKLLADRDYGASAFFSQQAAEKALKAVSLETTGKYRRIHDLVELGRDIQLPEPLLEEAKDLSLAYVFDRYPDMPGAFDLAASVAAFLRTAREIYAWTETRI